ncbi:MAG: cyclic nucleotide-binding domain-containing protein [Pikeienuella sp.]
MEIGFETGYLVHLAMLGYVAGFLFKDQIILRVLVLVGTFFYIAYYYAHPAEPLWGAIYASLMIIAANLIGLMRLVYSRLPVAIRPEHAPIRKELPGLEPGEFRALMRQGALKKAETDTVLTTANVPLSDLYFILEGEPVGEKDGISFQIKPGEFVGEVGFMLGGPASATVTLPSGGVYMRWDTPKLRRMINERPQLARAFEALIGRDMARKVAGSIRIELVERDPVLPALPFKKAV